MRRPEDITPGSIIACTIAAVLQGRENTVIARAGARLDEDLDGDAFASAWSEEELEVFFPARTNRSQSKGFGENPRRGGGHRIR